MRRLAESHANVLFLVRNVFKKGQSADTWASPGTGEQKKESNSYEVLGLFAGEARGRCGVDLGCLVRGTPLLSGSGCLFGSEAGPICARLGLHRGDDAFFPVLWRPSR